MVVEAVEHPAVAPPAEAVVVRGYLTKSQKTFLLGI